MESFSVPPFPDEKLRQEHLSRLIDYLKIPSVSADPSYAEHLQRCAAYTADQLRWAGLSEVELLSIPGAPPYVVGRRMVDESLPTVLIYGHYDVQPETPVELWTTPPFDPEIRDQRLFARGATDDKGQLFMHVAAIAHLLRCGVDIPYNIIFLVEGEEEIVSPNLQRFLASYGASLKCDLLVLSDTAMWDEGRPAITTSLRGMALMELTLSSAKRDLHSGTFGGAVANPLEMMSRLLTSLKDDEGRVLVEGFYQGVLPVTPTIADELSLIPFNEALWRQEIGISESWGDPDYSLLERLWMRPTLEINGLWGGYNGDGVKTVLPAQAHAKLSMRLVPNQDPAHVLSVVEQHLLAHLPPHAHLEVKQLPGSGRGIRVDGSHPVLQTVRRGLEEAFGEAPLLMGEGATIPVVAALHEALGALPVLIGFALPDAKCHAPDENIHLPTLHTGIEALIRIYSYFSGDLVQK
ncbi:dipeptidase [Magnetococcus sp. PR-3]|uniref:dipeptidase n=1 Tax=Magnetococcus sp. PR-3 TaxID=3120355 RepID=UPI002FCDF678